MFRLTIRKLLLLSSVAFLPTTAADPPPALPEVVARIEVLLAAGGGAPQEVREAIALLELAARAEYDIAAPLARHLAAQLSPLAGTAEPPDEGRRQELVRRAAATAAVLAKKLEMAAAGPPGRTLGAALTPPANDTCASAAALVDGEIFATTSGASNDGGASCGASAAAADVWYSYTASTDGLVAWDTFGSALDTVLSLHSACPDAGGDHELACNDDDRGTVASLVARGMSAGETVLVRVSGSGGASGSFHLNTDSAAGGVSGTVAKEATGEPIVHAVVELFDDLGFFAGFRRTGGDGSYLFPGLASASWFLRAYHDAYPPEVWDDVSCFQFCNPAVAGDPVEVTAGLVDGIDFGLEPGGSIEGTVTDDFDGGPLSGSIEVIDSDGFFRGNTFSGSTGTYRFGPLQAGTPTSCAPTRSPTATSSTTTSPASRDATR